MQNEVTIAVRSPGLAPETIRTVVIVPTFRRPDHLVLTLGSLAAQSGAPPFAVIVMENDTEGQAGLGAARPLFAAGAPAGLVLLAHARGNCSAYNAGLVTALAEFPAMETCLVLDDDEVASPGWAAALLRQAEASGADLVGGPVEPVFPARPGSHLVRHPVFTPPYRASGPVPILYGSGNVLIRRRVLEGMPRPFLDPAFNFIGGGDADFFARCRAAGFRFAWAADALIRETTPARRMEVSWLRARGLRDGAISSIIERRADRTGAGRLRTLAKSAGLLLASPWRSARLALATRSPTIGLYHLHVALGRFMAEFGLVHEQYRRPEQN